jgi:phosphoribosyl 1,2-cyclic phosphate phosphodiesterase
VTDAKSVSDRAVEVLYGVKVLILNALLERPHATHLSIDEAIEVAKSIDAPQTYFTHLTHKFTHGDLERRLPEGILPAYDGLTIAL